MLTCNGKRRSGARAGRLVGFNMGVRIIGTQAAQEMLPAEVELVRAAVARCSVVTLLADGMGEKRRVERELARAGVGLGAAVTVPAFWLADRWGLYGDGRAIVSASDRRLIMADVLARAAEADRGPLGANAGTVKLLARMASELLPQAAGTAAPGAGAAPAQAPSDAEACAARLLGRYRAELERRGLVEACEAAQVLCAEPAALRGCVVLRGVDALPAYLTDLLRAQARQGEVVFLLDAQGRAMADDLAQAFAPIPVAREAWADAPERVGAAAEELDEIFSHRLASTAGEAAGPFGEAAAPERLSVTTLSLAEIAGPTAQAHAEAELIEQAARNAAAGAHADGAGTVSRAQRITVIAPRPDEAFCRLAPWLAARGLAAEARISRTFAETYVGEQFFSLVDIAQSLANDPAGTWWPAPALSDWLLSPLSGCSRAEARAFDRKLRGNRQLTAEKVMSMLQGLQARERKARRERLAASGAALEPAPERAALAPTDPVPPTDGVACCDVVEALRRGRLLEALRLLAGAARRLGQGAFPELGPVRVQLEQQTSLRAIAFYQHAVADLRVCPEAALQALRDLRVSQPAAAAPAAPAGPCAGAPAARVRFMALSEAAAEPSASADAVVALDVDVESYPLSAREDAATALAQTLGREPVELAPAARVRRLFYRALRAARACALLARVAHDGAADDRYPAALWTELCSVAALPRVAGLPGEERFTENRAPAGPARLERAHHPAPAAITPAALPYLVLKRRDAAGDLVPRRLSASQIEGYLSCPYQWFLSSRVRPQELDAGFGPLETGNFVHDVMQRFHEELTGTPAGRVTQDNLPEELARLRRVFEAVRAQHAQGKTRTSGALIPLTSSEELQLEEVWRQLRRSVTAEADLLPGFKPAFAEYAFDKLDVTYAGWPLGGRIDRIDVDAAGRAVVIDYKHRALADFRLADPTARLEPGEGLDPAWLPAHVQTLIYAQAVRRAFAGELEVVGALYFGTRTGSFAGAVAEAYAADGMVPGLTRGFPGKDGALSFTDLLDHVEAAIAARLQGLARGDIAPADRPLDCRFCPAVSCERRKA